MIHLLVSFTGRSTKQSGPLILIANIWSWACSQSCNMCYSSA